ncbi:MAG: hypothetical protein ACRDQA_20475, partial [Nocardioidaceae bacterium]
MEMVLADVSSGAETPLELLYLQRVERAHGLPEGCRQRHRLVDGGVQWVDVDYEKYATLVELDGRIGHREDGVFRDHDRDNASTELGRSTLRYGWADCYHQPCAAAQQVVRVLWTNGWEENPRRCGPGCTLPVP